MILRTNRWRCLLIWPIMATLAAQGSQWGVDACLTRHVPDSAIPAFTGILQDSGVRFLRERDVGVRNDDGSYKRDVRDKYRELQAAGYQITAFATLPVSTKREQPANALVEDLREVYRQGTILGRDFAGLVDAWEILGEPDIGYCTDLPDRVAAYQKALYLGIKAAGAKEPSGSPMVLMGALGMTPGPWLEQAARNGLLDYTDAYNFHFYGIASDLKGTIAAHRHAMREMAGPRSLPLWITECGLNAVRKDDFLDPARRQLQADFTVSTARQALAAKDVAVFMPFILVNPTDPHALTLPTAQPLPAWDAYAKFTREHAWPKRPLASPPRHPNPVIVQWLPDNRTTLPNKTGGTYRFWREQPMRGEFRIYNFGSQTVHGNLQISPEASPRTKGGVLPPGGANPIRITLNGQAAAATPSLAIPPLGMQSVQVEFATDGRGYFRKWIEARFIAREDDSKSTKSPLPVPTAFFGLEHPATTGELAEEPLPLRKLPRGKIRFPKIKDYTPGVQAGVWTTMNGLQATGGPDGGLEAWLDQPDLDPLAPTMAVAAIHGVPARGFIRLQFDRPMNAERTVLVTLVDDRGQRYSIWENFGIDYYGSRSDVRLNLEDFHLDLFGRASADYRFRPERIREVQLRFYLRRTGEKLGVKLSVLSAKG